MLNLSRITTCLLIVIFLSACGSKPKPSPRPYDPLAHVNLSIVKNETKCQCDGANEWLMTNSNTFAVKARYSGVVTNLTTGNQESIRTESVLIPDGFSVPLGCTIAARGDIPACNFKFDFSKRSASKAVAAAAKVSDSTFSSLESCVDLCNEGSASCLVLPNGADAILSPIIALYDKALGEGKSELTIKEIEDSYGLADNKCDRGSIMLSEDGRRVENNSDEICKLDAFDKAITKAGKSLPSGSLYESMSVEFQDLSAEVISTATGSALKKAKIDRYIYFDYDGEAPYLRFPGEYNQKNHGAGIQYVAKMDELYVFSTQNGCVAVQAPQQ